MSRLSFKSTLRNWSYKNISDNSVQKLILQPGEVDVVDTYLNEASSASSHAEVNNIAIRQGSPNRRHGLIKWDLSILFGFRIERVELFLAPVVQQSVEATYSFWPILLANSAWTEEATWDHAVPITTRWAGDVGNDGGVDAGCSVVDVDYVGQVMGQLVRPANYPANTVLRSAVLDIDEVQAWVDGENHGMLITVESSNQSNFYNIHSSSSATPALRPRLEIFYR